MGDVSDVRHPEVPVACSLAGAEARAQVGEWHRLLAAPDVTVERLSPTALQLRWSDGVGPGHDVLRLARREKACCPFFTFTIEVGLSDMTLHIAVPEGAETALDALAGMDGSPPAQAGHPSRIPAPGGSIS